MKTKSNPLKTLLKVLIIIVIVIVGIYACLAVVNACFAMSLNNYIKKFESVKYDSSRLVPYVDDNGYYSIKADRDIKVLNFTDIHIGGGLWTAKQDRKTLYELHTMLQEEKPDLVILDGDNIFAVPGPIFNGGGTLNNKMVSKVVINFFENEQVYFTTVFGNHDTEAFDYYSRQAIANLYLDEKYEYCIFDQNFTDTDNAMPSVTNQCLLLKNSDDSIRKVIMLIDSNSYVDTSIMASINWQYDAIHDAQVDWAYDTISELNNKTGSQLKSLFFFHIPIGEYQVAYKDLEANGFKDTANTKYVSGVWDEKIDDTLGIRVWYGSCGTPSIAPQDADKLFERLGPDGLNTMEGCFCGHDHTNNAVVKYRGVTLSYGNSLDNIAYDDICESGLQRGATLITVKSDGSWTEQHKNAYTDYHCSTDEFYEIYLDHYYYEGFAPSNR